VERLDDLGREVLPAVLEDGGVEPGRLGDGDVRV
jgi:hypothetical protein